jgi:hypothetical protein
VLLASHQLSGIAADWWDAYVETHEEPESINWPEFRAAFRAHHVPHGVIKLKKKEFQDLKQGLSYPVFMPKPSTHRMHDLGSNVPHIRPKVLSKCRK